MTKSALNANQTKAIDGLLQRGTITGAAEYAGIHRNTVANYMREPSFMAELRRRQRETLDLVVLRLSRLAEGAALAYRDGLRTDEDISTRLRSADSVLSHLLRLRDSLDMEQRIQELEEAVSGTKS